MGGNASSPRHGRARRQAREPALTDLDLRVLALLSTQRVLTQTQLAALLADTPARTLRYRCNRLARHGLLGRTRPYRERGSAPHHLWPTRRGEALACGGPPPRGGERREPNPLFLAHAAGLSEIYVALKGALPAGATLARFDREAEAREAFTTSVTRKERAIAPDAFIEIADGEGGKLLAFIELDMGSMSHPRLKRKAAGYAEYERANAWRGSHRFCPALLFITTTEKRARSFLRAMRKELGRDALLLTCVCDLARRLDRCATEARWLLDVDGEQGVDLLAALREARRPYDEEQARAAAQRQGREAQCEQLRSDPEALRARLREWGSGRPVSDDELLAAALAITIEREGQLREVEREALLAFGAMLDDPLGFETPEREPSRSERRAFEALIDHHRTTQRQRVGDLAQRFGEGPTLRAAGKRIAEGELFGEEALSQIAEGARHDNDAEAERGRLLREFLAWREQEAKRRAKEQGLLARLRNRPDAFLTEIDHGAVRFCRRCEEIAVPDPERAERNGERHVAVRCHFCGGRKLATLEEVRGAMGGHRE